MTLDRESDGGAASAVSRLRCESASSTIAAFPSSQAKIREDDHRFSVVQQSQHIRSRWLFSRALGLPRGVKLSAAGKLFLTDARRILRDVNEAASRAARVARGQSGTLRVGFTENASWRGVVPASLRRFRKRQPDVELQLTPATSLEQIEDIRSGRLDAGFVFNMPKADAELDQIAVALHSVILLRSDRWWPS